jgi:hypothetical protein
MYSSSTSNASSPSFPIIFLTFFPLLSSNHSFNYAYFPSLAIGLVGILILDPPIANPPNYSKNYYVYLDY